MFRVITFLAVLTLLVFSQTALAQGTFQETPLGDPLGTGMFVLYHDLDVGADNMPVAVWSDGTTINAARWDGAAWQPLGDAVTSNGELFSKLAVGDDGTVIITYLSTTDDGSSAELRASLFDGTAWTPLGDVINLYQSGTFNFDEAVAITPDGPVIAWREAQEFMQPDQLYVRLWDGSGWQSVGGTESLSTDASFEAGISDIAVLSDGSFAVAYDQSGTTSTRLWDGAAWQTLPDLPGQEAEISFLRLDNAPDGSLILYRYYYGTLQDVHQVAGGDPNWTSLSEALIAVGLDDSSYVDDADLMVQDDGTVWLAWSYGGDGTAGLVKWDGTTWTAVSDPFTFMEQPTGYKAPVALGSDGSVYLARLNESLTLQVSQFAFN
ncbi:MAG TPA: hypothetical protein VHP83_16550 [Aggregatilineaceae bacterium]|nr:hypothetical protein [Aggregatilineaceae bacterium]